MYRAVALLALRSGADPADAAAMTALANARPISVVHDAASPDGFHVFAGDERLGSELYGNDVSRVVSAVAAHQGLRDLLVERQRAIAAQGPVIMAGRDIGTVVLPDAPLKIFLTASAEARVERRLAELAERGTAVDRATLRAQIEERDRLDSDRIVAPLRPAADAIAIDSSNLTPDQVVDRIVALALAKPGSR
jgi:cytidylate kinase